MGHVSGSGRCDDRVACSAGRPGQTVTPDGSDLISDPSGWSISTAIPGDLTGLKDMLRQAQLPDSGVVIGEFERYLIARDAGGELIGGVGLELRGNDALLRSLVVRPEARGAGVGQALLAAAESLARGQGIDTLYLLTFDAAAFFHALGFVAQERESVPHGIRGTAEFASLCPASAICLRKHMTPATRSNPRPGRPE
ncbi:MAG: arsenic resistance N-acetyltransferase ArsN2 [Gammaproteobacteria bacterium]